LRVNRENKLKILKEHGDSSLGKISNLSPLGSAVLGKKKGDSFVVETKKGNVKYIVHEIK
jgi:transcription elongation GreA/GreB family factor